MPAYTSYHRLPYPRSDEPVGMGNKTLAEFAESVDTKLSVVTQDGLFKSGRNVAAYVNPGTNLSGYMIIDTPLRSLSTSNTIHIRGMVAQASHSIIDLNVGFFYNGATISNVSFSNQGSFYFKEVLFLNKTSTSTLSLALLPETASNLWQRPAIYVDALVGTATNGAGTHTDQEVKNGWSIRLAPDTTGYTTSSTQNRTWIPVTTFANGWVNFDARTLEYMVTSDKWVRFRGIIKGGTVGTVPAWTLNQTALKIQTQSTHEVHVPVISNSAWGMVSINAVNMEFRVTDGSNAWVDCSTITYRIV